MSDDTRRARGLEKFEEVYNGDVPAPPPGTEQAGTLGEVSLRLDRVAVGDQAWMPPFDRVALLATVTGPEPPPDSAPRMLIAWRDGGGTVEIKEFTLLWGKVEIRAEGSIALDAETRLIGALTAKVKGHRGRRSRKPGRVRRPASPAAGRQIPRWKTPCRLHRV